MLSNFNSVKNVFCSSGFFKNIFQIITVMLVEQLTCVQSFVRECMYPCNACVCVTTVKRIRP